MQKLKIMFWYYHFFMNWLGFGLVGLTPNRQKKIQSNVNKIRLLSTLTNQTLWQSQNLKILNQEKFEAIFQGIDMTKKVSVENMKLIKSRLAQSIFGENQ
ncbi:MAG: hypothetical protein WAX22_02945 [Lactococcus hircilactis]|uniref:hypothetical protein n=1 Tax=Lactococcus hircilactis TaxID=1494462 RepID=UPI003BD7C1BE